MQICRNVTEIRAAVAGFRANGESVGLVTTMGALHAGHMQLVKAARAKHDRVVVTIFVNPTQFGSSLDLDAYPRTEEADVALLTQNGADAVFIPTVDVMYPAGDETIVETTNLANVLHGLVRPGHFRGVATVVTKFLNIVGADTAFFGEKDYQQLAVIRRMAKDLFIPTAIAGVPTVRAEDGLALSSRNRRLSASDLNSARILSISLNIAEDMVAEGKTVEEIYIGVRSMIEAEWAARFKGCDIVWADDFSPASGKVTRPIGIMISAEFGSKADPVMLIDQREIHPKEG